MGLQRVGHNLATEQQWQRDSGFVSTLCHHLSMSKVASVVFLAMLWTVACQALLSTEFSRQEYWSGLPCLPPGDLPNPGIKPGSPTLWQILYHLSHQGLTSIYNKQIFINLINKNWQGIPCGVDSKESACNAGDPDLIPGSGRSSGGGHGSPYVLA